MVPSMNPTTTPTDPTYQRLVESPLYQTYKKAFKEATGFHLCLVPADADTSLAKSEERFVAPFCQKLNEQGSKGCRNCLLANRCLHQEDSTNTVKCFAQLRETSIPVRSGNLTVGYLTTGQVFTETPDEEEFESILGSVSGPVDPEELREKWLSSRTVSQEQYYGVITLLAAFALQLSELMNRILVENETSEPETVIRAKRFINSNLDEKLSLDMVASQVGVSSYYFCKLFKQSTGMTLTEYINRRRVEWAKRKLMDPRVRVTEVAYDVGYQSLSQFNRSFGKYAGMSPTQYRERQHSKHYEAAIA